MMIFIYRRTVVCKVSGRKSRAKITVRTAEPEDIPNLYNCQRLAYGGMSKEELCSERLLTLQQNAFPEGILLAEVDDALVGYATCLIVQLDEDSPWYSYDEITGGGAFTTHSPSGDTLYGADIAVHPDYRGRGVSTALYKARKKLLRRLNLKRMVAGGRIPGYESVADRMDPEEYVDKVVTGQLIDPSLNAHLRAGYQVKGVHHGYLDDEQSLNYATFLEYENPHFRPNRHRISVTPLKRRHSKIRLCLAQSDFASIASFEQLLDCIASTLHKAENLGVQLLLLPDRWYPLGEAEANPKRAGEFSEFLESQCRAHGLYLAGEKYPLAPHESGHLVLYGPSGELGSQSRLHISDRHQGQTKPPAELLLFDTSLGRIGLLAGYDVVFPEVVRRLTLSGMQLLLCPIATNERNEYLRLRYCAKARAVENSIFVGLCNKGDSTSYGESAVFTPCDFGFPDSGDAARAGTFGPTSVVHDLDLGSLEAVREIGVVTPLKDRRLDVCGLDSQVRVRTVREGEKVSRS